MAGAIEGRFGRPLEQKGAVAPAIELVPVPEPKSPIIVLEGISLRGDVEGHFAMVHFSPVHRGCAAVKEIQQAVCAASDVRIEHIQGKDRTASVVLARHIGMMLCRILTNRSLPDIGRRFGGRDHTTVLHALQKMQPVMDAIKDQAGQIPLCDFVALAYQTYREIKPKSPRRGRRVPINM